MRDYHDTTRHLIATLYIRMRNSRRIAARMAARHGDSSGPAVTARATAIADWNALIAVKMAQYDQILDPKPTTMTTREWVKMIARGATVRRKANETHDGLVATTLEALQRGEQAAVRTAAGTTTVEDDLPPVPEPIIEMAGEVVDAIPGETDFDRRHRNAAGGYTMEELEAAFTAVQNSDHWKNPIHAIVARDQVGVLTKAIPWYTGTSADFDDVDGQPDKVLVTAPGYYAGPCN